MAGAPSSSEGATPKRSYTHSDYVCEKCRKAHRRCKHDPSADPTFDPSKIRKRQRRKAPNALCQSPGATAAPEALNGIAYTALIDTHSRASMSPLSTSGAGGAQMTDQELLSRIRPIFPQNKPMQQQLTDFGVDLLSACPPLRAAAVAYCMGSHNKPFVRAEVESHTQTAIRQSSAYAGAEGVFTDYLLAYNTFALSGAFTAYFSHTARTRTRLLSCKDARLSYLFVSDRHIVEGTLVQHAEDIKPFLTRYPESRFEAWQSGNLADLLSLVLDACNLLTVPPSITVKDVLHHLFSFMVTRPARSDEAFSNLMCESVFLLCMSKRNNVPTSWRDSLIVHTKEVEHGFDSMTFPRRVLKLIGHDLESSMRLDDAKMHQMRAFVFGDSKLTALIEATACDHPLIDRWWREVNWVLIKTEPALLAAAYSLRLLHLHWPQRRQEAFDYAFTSKQQAILDPKAKLLFHLLHWLITVASGAGIEAWRHHFDCNVDAYVSLVSNLDQQPDSFRQYLMHASPVMTCARRDLDHFPLFREDFESIFPEVNFIEAAISFGIGEVLSYVLHTTRLFFNVTGDYRASLALHEIFLIGPQLRVLVNRTQPQGLFRITTLEAGFALNCHMAYPGRAGPELRESLAGKLIETERVCQRTLHFIRFVLSALDGAIYQPMTALYS
ncbi:hypothetical protein BCR37DRAFT_162868 [Protomyces lactucae-debilis]|uniref:Uncharacterized protein n=1 Tax=Protomyces lactucae-debilis TaxID=2754530 RepID=A0A1Y2F000_PROLT|nr:uncharacterized protein BCR37DRAFT_162868 [Protomyces lactucae-debilis]ORY76696.1 hypothetical protein BCR37DRAFT_162868 [Protomyces lactucae-debilis]